MKHVFMTLMFLDLLATGKGPAANATPIIGDPSGDNSTQMLEQEVAGALGLSPDQLEKEMSSIADDDGSGDDGGSDDIGDDDPLGLGGDVTNGGEGDDDLVDNGDDATNPLDEVAPVLEGDLCD